VKRVRVGKLVALFMAVLLAAAIAETGLEAAETVWVDEFNGSMGSDWTWLSGDGEVSSLAERFGFLRIETQIHGGRPPYGAVVRPAPAGDFVMETKAVFKPFGNFQRAGLLIYGDSDNFLVLSRAFCGFVAYGCVENGIYYDSTQSTESFATATASQDTAWLRLTKSGTEVRAEYSENGVSWQQVGTHTLSSSGPIRIGLVSDGDRDGAGRVSADFDFFRVRWQQATPASGEQGEPEEGPDEVPPTASAATRITDVLWVAEDGFIEVLLDPFTEFDGWTMYVNGAPVSMDGGAGGVVVRPNAPIAAATGVFIGTEPWVSGLENANFPCSGTLQFDIPGQGRTNEYAFALNKAACCTAKECSKADPVALGPPDAAKIAIGAADQDGFASVTGAPGAVPPYATVWIENLDARNVVLTDADAQGAFQATLFAPPGSSVMVKVDPSGTIARMVYGRMRTGCPDDGSEINPLWGTILPAGGTKPGTGSLQPFSAVGSFRECTAWTGWWLDGTLELWSFGLSSGLSAYPGDSGRIRGTVRFVSSALETASLASLSAAMHFNLVRMFDDDGSPAAWRMWFNSYLFTPTGLPIELESHARRVGIGHVELTGFRRISDCCVEADFSVNFSIPMWVDSGQYQVLAYLDRQGSHNIPLGFGEATINTWYHWDPETALPQIAIGDPSAPRIPWALFGDVPINGNRGITAREDADDFVMPNRVVTPTHLPIVPPIDEVSGAPIAYRLDLGSHWISASERRTPCPPHIPLALPSGQLAVHVARPDGTAHTLGPAPIRQSLVTTPTTPGGSPIDHGTGQISDLYHISTMDEAFEYVFDQWGEYTLTFTGSIADIYGIEYPIESTYDFIVARVLDLDPAQLPTTPFVVGDSLAPGLHVFPAVPADVEIRLTHMPYSDPLRVEIHTIKGRANRYGVFAPDSSDAYRFDQPGEYRIDYTATYRAEDGTLWAGTMTWGTVVADGYPPLTAHGRRGMDYTTNGRIDDMPAWFEVFDLPSNKRGIENYYPYFSGDIHWGNEDRSPGDSIHSVITIEDNTPDERFYDALIDRWSHNVSGYRNPPDDPPTLSGLLKRIDVGEAPLFITTSDGSDPRDNPDRIDMWAYWYGSSERPDVRVREIISVDSIGTAYWRFNDTYGYQLGESAEGDVPGDLKWEFGGAVFRLPDEGVATYGVYSSLWALLPHGDPIGARVTPPFQDATGASINGGPIMELLGEDIDMLFLPKALRPGDILELGDTVAFSGHVGPPLDSRVEVRMTSPSGIARDAVLRANEIGWVYDRSFDFSANEVGRWTVDVFVVHDRPYVGNGVTPTAHNTGTVLGTLGEFSFYVVETGQPPITITSPSPGRLPWPEGKLDMGNRIRPIVIRGTAFPGADAIYVTVHDKGTVMVQRTLSPDANGNFAFTYDAEQLHRSFPFVSLTAREGYWEGLSNEVAITFLAVGGGNAQAAAVTLIGEEVFISEP